MRNNASRLLYYHKALTSSAPWAAIDAALEIAQTYQNGDLDHHPDFDRARAWWKKAIDQGAWGEDLAQAAFHLVSIDYTRLNVTSELDHCYALLRQSEADTPVAKLAEIGLASIPFMLGEMCQYVAEVERERRHKPKDLLAAHLRSRAFFLKAETYYRLATELPDVNENFAPARAHNALGLLHHYGFGVEKNDNKASLYFQRAALAGLAEGMLNLAQAHIDGHGADVSVQTAETLLACALHRTHDQAALSSDKATQASQLFETLKEANKSPYYPLISPKSRTPKPLTP